MQVQNYTVGGWDVPCNGGNAMPNCDGKDYVNI